MSRARHKKAASSPKAEQPFPQMRAEAKASTKDKLKEVGHVGGGLSRLRLDRPGRKRGGRVGADSAPLSSAARSCD